MEVRIVNRGAAERLDLGGQPSGAPIEQGEVIFEGRCIAALVSTIPYWGFGARVFPFAEGRPADRFCLRVVATSPLHIAAHMLSAWKGTYRDENLIDVYAEDVEFEFDGPTAIEIGGDPAGMTDSMHARLHPEPVKLIDYSVR
jgi:diacylglycerol kinase family enzyme